MCRSVDFTLEQVQDTLRRIGGQVSIDKGETIGVQMLLGKYDDFKAQWKSSNRFCETVARNLDVP
jgi:hypothetical protein